MFRATLVHVGPYNQSLHENDESRLLAAFTDNNFRVSRMKSVSYIEMLGYGPRVLKDLGEEIEIRAYHADAREVAERLDVLGFDLASSLAVWEENLAETIEYAAIQEREDLTALAALDGHTWLALLRELAELEPPKLFSEASSASPSPGSPEWLIRLSSLAYDPLRELRLIVAAFPEARVIADVTSSGSSWVGSHSSSHASMKLSELRLDASLFSPVVVLTEGRTDAEFLSAALSLLYPHLVDMISFLDFGQKNEGGAGALTRLLKSFAAAGIVNRTVAIFDNDSAASDAVRSLDTSRLPNTVKVQRYPDLDLATSFPTIGPPTIENPTGKLIDANVNGLAASIELYLGRDVLTTEGGDLSPVQWTAFISGVGTYQGEVVNKGEIHQRFRKKIAAARQDPSVLEDQDWSGLRSILRQIMSAFS